MPPLSFGTLPTGERVNSYTLTNAGGLKLELITYGATVKSLHVPDRHGNLADVVLGFSDLAGYLAPHPYVGATVGRVAGRIRDACFVLDDGKYPLAANNGPHHLHGGLVGFSRRNWTATPLERVDGAASLRLAYRSADGEEGYPGQVDLSVTYTVTADNALMLETEATTTRATPLSPTHHSYFNLAGEGTGTIEEHELQILAETYAPADDQMALLGKRAPVVPGGNDFNQPRRLADALPHLFQAHGDLYFLPRLGVDASPGNQPRRVARVVEPTSGRVLTVQTTEDCLQFYTGAGLDGSLVGKSGRTYGPYAGFCLECEGYPDGVRTPELGNIVLRPGQTFRQTTIYSFSTT